MYYDKQIYPGIIVESNRDIYNNIYNSVDPGQREQLGWKVWMLYDDYKTIENIVQSKSPAQLIDISKDNPLLPEVKEIIEARITGQEPPTFY